MSSPFSLDFVKKEKIAKDTYSFYFDRKNYDFSFKAGEYVKVHLDLINPDERGSNRYFTIASSPLDKDSIIITTKVIRSSFKKRLLTLSNGESINFFGPLGNFVIKDKKGPFVFLAGGIGVTTFYSMIKYSYEIKNNNEIILIASFSELADVIYKDEFEKIAINFPKIKVVYTLTHEKKNIPTFENGRISEEIIRKYVINMKDSKFFAVGPSKMVEDIVSIVKEMGVSSEKIQTENFTGY